MGNSGSIKFEITVDNSGAISGIRKVGDEANDAGEKGQKSFKAFNTILGETGAATEITWGSLMKVGGTVVGVLGLQAALGKMKDETLAALKASSDLNEIGSKFNVVFSGQSQVAEGWAKTLVNSYAMSTREAKDYLSSMQSLLVPMGMTSTAAGKMSNDIVKLSADMGSFNNLKTADVMRDIKSGLVGEYETMRKYGVALSATTVEQRALTMHLAATKDALTAADKAQAAYAIIVDSSKAAIGDMARTQDSYANQLKKAEANVEDFRAALGEGMLPVAALVLKRFNEWSASTLGNRDALIQLSRDGVVILLKAVGAGIEIVQDFHNSWMGLKMMGTGAVAAIAGSMSLFYNDLRLMLGPIDAIMIGLKAMGVINANPFDTMRDSLAEFAKASTMMFDDTVADTQRINTAYNKASGFVQGLVKDIDKLGPAGMAAADANVEAASGAGAKINQLTEAQRDKLLKLDFDQYVAEQEYQKKRADEIAKQLKAQVDAEERAAKEKLTAEEKMYNDLKFDAVGYREFKEKQLLEEYDRLVKTTGDSVNAYLWYTKQIEALDKEELTQNEKNADQKVKDALRDAETLRHVQERATNDALRLLGDESTTAVDIRKKQNAEILANAKVTDAERLRLATLIVDNEAELLRRAAEDEKKRTIEKLENSKNMYDMAKGYAEEYFTISHDDSQKLTEAWIRGEDLKTVASGMAKDKLIGFASNLASGYFDKMAEGIVIEIKNWLGLGASQASTLGDTWQEKLGSVAGYLAGMAGAMAGARAISGYADGGWLGANPGGGMINQGSGYRDDVFLGFTGGGSTANFGMGGEFVINKNATAKHKSLLYAINADRYADGGPIRDPREIANAVNGSGFGTFVQAWADSGDWKEAVVKAIVYYAGAFGGALSGNAMGRDYLGFANGGMIRARGFGLGDFFDDLVGGSPLPGLDLPTVGDIIDDPMLLIDNKVTRLADQLGLSSDYNASLSTLAAKFWGADFGGAMAQIRDSVDAHLIPFYTDILTPGKAVDFTQHPEGQIKGIFEAILSHPEAALGLANGGQLPAYANGTPYVPRTGLALVHQGEEITPAWANSGRRDAAEAVDALRDEIAPLLFVMATNTQRTTRYLDNWETNGLPETRT